MDTKTVAVIGGLDIDLIMLTDRIPNSGESVLANEYLEVLGGKGANSAIVTYRACHDNPVQNPYTRYTRMVDKDPTTNFDPNIEVRMIGAIGDNRYSENFITELKKNGVYIDLGPPRTR